MKAALLAVALALCGQSVDQPHLSTPPPISNESDTNLLITKSSVEALIDTANLSLESGRCLRLEPGVRVTKSKESYTLATHDGGKVEIELGAERLSFASPLMLRITDLGWEFNGAKPISLSSATARRRQQDDADSNLKSMQESAKKLKANSQDKLPRNKLRVRWLYGDNPLVQAEIFNSPAIQQLVHISPQGF
jgi:hypothetical protein